MTENKKVTKAYTIRFPPESTKALKEMSKEEGITNAELIRRAIKFYQVRIEAKKKNKKIVLETEDGNREWVVV